MSRCAARERDRYARLTQHDTLTVYYFVRHGQHDRLPGDRPLNAIGRRQAEQTAAYLAAQPVDFGAVHASPLARARETAAIIAAEIGLPLVMDERLRERANFGDLSGQSFEEFVDMWRRCDENRTYEPPVGLSAQANGERLQEWMLEIYNVMPSAHVIACTHGGTITDYLLNRYAESALERMHPAFRDRIANCSITIVRVDRSRLALEALASTDHLS